MSLPETDSYTFKDIYALPEGRRAELIDGQMYDMAPPSTIHQRLVAQFTKTIGQYIDQNNGPCQVYPAPFAVFLAEDDKNYVEPDISVICDSSKLDSRGCKGAPDWIIEIVSASSKQLDYGIKLFKYRTVGVREYWIVNPLTQTATIYDFEHDEGTSQYSFDEQIPVCIYKDLVIKIADLL